MKFLSLITTPFRMIATFFSRLFRMGGKAPKFSLAFKLAMLLFFALFIFDIAIILLLIFGDSLKIDRPWIAYPLMILSPIVFPLILYWAVRLYSFEWPSLYDEIDECWEAFEDWLEDQDLEVEDVPVFMVIGTDSIGYTRTLHRDAKFSLNGMPSGAGNWMYWYGDKNGVYLHLKDCCTLSGVITKAKRQRPGNQQFASIETKTLVVDNDMYWDEKDGDSGFSIGAEQLSLEDTVPSAPFLSLDPDADFNGEGFEDPDAEPQEPETTEEEEDHDANRVEYLTYVCHRLRKAKSGFIPLRGVLIVLPFDIFQRESYCVRFAEAAKTDLDVITRELEVDLPVSVLFGSMEFDKGFAELKGGMLQQADPRVAQKIQASRFGVGVDIAEIPRVDAENFKVFSERLNQYFRSWVMNVYRKRDRLSQQDQNRQIYRLMANIRIKFRYQLVRFLEKAIGEFDKNGSQTGPFLTGCFFATTSENDHGFIRGFFAKTLEFADSTGWSDAAIKRDQRYSTFAGLLMLSSMLLIGGAVVITLIAAGYDFF